MQKEPKKEKTKRPPKPKKLSSESADARKLFTSKDPIIRLSTDMKEAARLMGVLEARYLVDTYYTYQNVRIRAAHQVDRCAEVLEPTEVLRWTHGNFDKVESDVKKALGIFAAEYAAGEWLQSICGIATVLSAGFLTTFDIRERFLAPCTCADKDQDRKHGPGKRMMRPIGGSAKDHTLRFRCTGRRGKGEKEGDKDAAGPQKDKSCKVVHEINSKDLRAGEGVLIRPKTVGHWWNYAGLNPEIVWKKKEMRPWNARAKVLSFKAGSSFQMVQNKESDVYGHLFAARKYKETQMNREGAFENAALVKAEDVGEKTRAYSFYSKGKLPPAHIEARARRYAVKIFLSHFHDVAYRDYYGEAPPVPFVFSEHCKTPETHTHYIEPPYIKSEGKSLRQLYGEM